MPGGDDVIRNLRDWGERKRAAAIALAQNWAGEIEARGKSRAPWRDRTGNARNGLFGSTQITGLAQNEIKIVIGHSVEYGVFLELANDGRYAVLKPTLDAAAPEIFESYRRLWE